MKKIIFLLALFISFSINATGGDDGNKNIGGSISGSSHAGPNVVAPGANKDMGTGIAPITGTTDNTNQGPKVNKGTNNATQPNNDSIQNDNGVNNVTDSNLNNIPPTTNP